MPTTIIAGNWKMNTTLNDAKQPTKRAAVTATLGELDNPLAFGERRMYHQRDGMPAMAAHDGWSRMVARHDESVRVQVQQSWDLGV